MKKSLLVFIITFTVLLSCSQDNTPVIGMTMSYREGKYIIDRSYVDAIRENGGRVHLIPCSSDEDLLRRELEDLDGIVLTGGPDYNPAWYGKSMHPSISLMDPHRGGFDSLFVRLALESGKPILGICAGEQLLNIAAGGKLFLDQSGHRNVKHMIYIDPSSHMSSLFGDSLLVNSWHHQCVDPVFMPPDYRVTALSADSVVEAMEYTGNTWILGTQFHPERLPEEQRDKFFTRFIREASKK